MVAITQPSALSTATSLTPRCTKTLLSSQLYASRLQCDHNFSIANVECWCRSVDDAEDYKCNKCCMTANTATRHSSSAPSRNRITAMYVLVCCQKGTGTRRTRLSLNKIHSETANAVADVHAKTNGVFACCAH
jgi:hypothetical protein